jgi:hypothetical protein
VEQGPCQHRYYTGVVIGGEGEGEEGEWWCRFVAIVGETKGGGAEEEEPFGRGRNIGLGVFGFAGLFRLNTGINSARLIHLPWQENY